MLPQLFLEGVLIRALVTLEITFALAVNSFHVYIQVVLRGGGVIAKVTFVISDLFMDALYVQLQPLPGGKQLAAQLALVIANPFMNHIYVGGKGKLSPVGTVTLITVVGFYPLVDISDVEGKTILLGVDSIEKLLSCVTA